MTSPVRGRAGRAFVEIVGDTSKFSKDVERKINEALAEVGLRLNFEPIVEAGGRGGAKTGAKFSKEFDREARRGVAATGKAAANEVVVAMADAAVTPRNRNRIFTAFAALGSTAARAISSFGSGILDVGESVGQSVIGGFSGLVGLLPQVGSGFAMMALKIYAVVVAVLLLLPALTLLVTTLLGLVGVLNILPAAIGVLVAAILPLVVAFQNFGGALSAIMEGDPEKIAEAMKKLTPAARSVAREFAILMPFFRQLQRITQQALFAPLAGSLTRLFEAIGPEVTTGFQNIAGALGRMIAAIIAVGETPAVQTFLKLLFGGGGQGTGAVARIIDALTPSITKLLGAFTEVGTAGLPVVERVAGAIATALGAFADFLTEATASGDLNMYLEDGLEIAGLLKDMIFELIGLFKVMFDETKEGGKEFLRDITDTIRKLKEYFESPEGKEALKTMVNLALDFAYALDVGASAAQRIFTWLDKIYRSNLIGLISGPLAVLSASRQLADQNAASRTGRRLAAGGLVVRPTFALVGEAGPEAVVPLNNPRRAAEVMDQAGLLPLGSMMGAGGLVVQVWLGTQQITDILDQRVENQLAETARRLSGGTRPPEAL